VPVVTESGTADWAGAGRAADEAGAADGAVPADEAGAADENAEFATAALGADIVPLLIPLMIIGGERRKRRENALEHTGEL
jgi:hypothetical protein